jgi:hypothetical protein
MTNVVEFPKTKLVPLGPAEDDEHKGKLKFSTSQVIIYVPMSVPEEVLNRICDEEYSFGLEDALCEAAYEWLEKQGITGHSVEAS